MNTTLIATAHVLGYKNRKGYCNGASIVWLQTMLLDEVDEEQKLEKRLRDLEERFPDNLFELALYQVQLGQGKSANHNQEFLDTLSYFNAIELYQNPNLHQDVFNKKLSQFDYTKISQIAGSTKLLQLGGLTSFYTHSDFYSKDKLQNYLQALGVQLTQINLQMPVGMIITNVEHAIGIVFLPKRDTWKMMDINPHFEIMPNGEKRRLDSTPYSYKEFSLDNLSEFADRILQSFKSDVLNFTAIIPAKHPNAKELITQFNIFKASHQVDVSQYPLAKLSELAAIAITRGDLALIRELNKSGFTFALCYKKSAADHAAAYNQIAMLREFLKPTYAVDFKKSACEAAQEGNIKVLRELLNPAYKIDFNQTDNGSSELTPFLIAAFCGKLEIIQELTKPEYKVDFFTVSKEGFTALHIAAQNGHVEVIKELKKPIYKIDFNQQGPKGETAFLKAVENGHYLVVKELLKPEYDIDYKKHSYTGITPIYSAAYNGHAHILRLLQAEKPDLDFNGYGVDGYTLPSIAAQQDQVEVLETLAMPEFKVDFNKPNRHGGTPLFYAVSNNHEKCVSILIKYSSHSFYKYFKSSPTSLITFVGEDKTAIARTEKFITWQRQKHSSRITIKYRLYDLAWLIGNQTIITLFEKEYRRRLQDAIVNNDIEAIKFQVHADSFISSFLNKKDEQGKTLLEIAVEEGKNEAAVIIRKQLYTKKYFHTQLDMFNQIRLKEQINSTESEEEQASHKKI